MRFIGRYRFLVRRKYVTHVLCLELYSIPALETSAASFKRGISLCAQWVVLRERGSHFVVCDIFANVIHLIFP